MKKIFYLTSFALLLVACDTNQKQKESEPMISKKEVKLTSKIMTPETPWYFGRLGEVKVSPDGKSIAYIVSWYDIEQNQSNSDIYIMDTNGENQKQLTRSAEKENCLQWRPDGKYIGFIRNGKIIEIKPDGSDEREITFSGFKKEISEFTYAPTGDKILLAVETPVEKVLGKDLYPDLPEANAYTSDDLMYRHWDTWEDGSYSHLYIAGYSDGKSGIPEDIMPNEPWDAPTKPFDDITGETSWSPDGKILAYSCKKLKGKEYAETTNSDIYLYRLETKKTDILTQGMNGYDKHPLFSPDGKKLLWLSMEREGYEADKARIFIYDFETENKSDYSKNFDSSPSSIEWAEDGKSLILTACFDETFRVFRMELPPVKVSENTGFSTGAMPPALFTQISKDGFFDYQNVQSTDKNELIVVRSQIVRPSEIYKLDPATGESVELSLINKDILDQLDLPGMEQRFVKTTDNKEMPVWVILPPDFDKSKKYPAILMCPGGPQGEVSQSYSYRWNFALMASKGYVVVYPGRRGVSGYGQAWTDAVSKDHGGQPERDLLSAVDNIAGEPWIDKNRLAAVGASYGGFSVYWLAGNHDKRFKAFIAHCGIFDMKSMYTTTEEMFFENWETGGPFWDENNQAAQKSYAQSPMNFVKKWDTPILIFEGERDYRVPYTQGLAAFNTARMLNIPARLVVFPEETHWVLKPQNAILWQREFFGWLEKYLN